jgi:predicted  nucleic acid-binding Zn-ribbon protein
VGELTDLRIMIGKANDQINALKSRLERLEKKLEKLEAEQAVLPPKPLC